MSQNPKSTWSHVVRGFDFHGARVNGIVMPDGSEPQVKMVVVHGVNIIQFLEGNGYCEPLMEKLHELLQEEVK